MGNPEIKAYLEKTGLLNTRPKGNSLHLSANDSTWGWVEAHLSDELPKTKAVFQLQTEFRKKLAAYLAVRGLRLGDVLSPVPESVSLASLAEQVRRAYLDASQGQFDVRVRLRDLRPQLENLSREQQNSALLEMQRDGWLVLDPNDDPQDRNGEDDAAALILGDRRRDLVYLHREQRS